MLRYSRILAPSCFGSGHLSRRGWWLFSKQPMYKLPSPPFDGTPKVLPETSTSPPKLQHYENPVDSACKFYPPRARHNRVILYTYMINIKILQIKLAAKHDDVCLRMYIYIAGFTISKYRGIVHIDD